MVGPCLRETARSPTHYRFRVAVLDQEAMNEMSGRTMYKETLRPTPRQEQAREFVLWRCRTLDNVALEQRITAWERCHFSVSRSQQEAELKDLRASMPEYAAIHSPVLPDVL